MIDAGVAVSGGVEIEASSEAQSILSEASIVAEQKMREKFPEIPVSQTVFGSEKAGG